MPPVKYRITNKAPLQGDWQLPDMKRVCDLAKPGRMTDSRAIELKPQQDQSVCFQKNQIRHCHKL